MSDARSAEEIQRDIEHTRGELADTAAALAERADVKARAHEKIDDARSRITGRFGQAKAKVTDSADTAKTSVAGATPASVAGGAQHAVGSAAQTARSNPIAATLVAGFAVGLLVGWRVASRRG